MWTGELHLFTMWEVYLLEQVASVQTFDAGTFMLSI